MNQRIQLDYNTGSSYIEEGDVLLFRGTGLLSWFIKKAGEGDYAHCGVASWTGRTNEHRILECIEFREGSPLGGLFSSNALGGGRAVSLKNEVEKYPKLIDVYRPVNYFSEYKFDPATGHSEIVRIPFDGYAVARTMRKMTGLPYGWKRILWIAKHKLAGLRLIFRAEDLTDDTLKEVIYPICSTALAYSFSCHKYDLVKNKSDAWTEPSDIARSGRLSYLFTLKP